MSRGVKTPHRKTRIDGGGLNIVIMNRRGITDRSLNVSVRLIQIDRVSNRILWNYPASTRFFLNSRAICFMLSNSFFAISRLYLPFSISIGHSNRNP